MKTLLAEIEDFLSEPGTRLSASRFGFLAARNSRLVERLREGRPILTSTEDRVRAFIASRRQERKDAA